MKYIVPVQTLETPSHSMNFPHFYYFLHYRANLKTSKLWRNISNYAVNKTVEQNMFLYFIFFSLLLPWWQLCTLLAFSQSVSCASHLEWFSNSLKGVPKHSQGAEHLLATLPLICSSPHPKPTQLGLGQVTVEASSSDAALHHSPSWSDIPYIAWTVWSHCTIEKQMTVPPSANQMGWHVAAECCGSNAG